MHQEAAESGLPPTRGPKESSPDGPVGAGKLLWPTAGGPGQHLGGRDVAKYRNRYRNSKKQKKRKTQHCHS